MSWSSSLKRKHLEKAMGKKYQNNWIEKKKRKISCFFSNEIRDNCTRVDIMDPGVRALLCYYCYCVIVIEKVGSLSQVMEKQFRGDDSRWNWRRVNMTKSQGCAGWGWSEGSNYHRVQHTYFLIHTTGGRGTRRTNSKSGKSQTKLWVGDHEKVMRLILRIVPNCPWVLVPAAKPSHTFLLKCKSFGINATALIKEFRWWASLYLQNEEPCWRRWGQDRS